MDFTRNSKKSWSAFADLFISSFTLHNLKRGYRENLLKEIFRVLKKYGVFINCDKYALDNKNKDKELFDRQIEKIVSLFNKINRPDLKEPLIGHEKQDISDDFIMREGEFIGYANSLGFSNIRTLYRENREAIMVMEK